MVKTDRNCAEDFCHPPGAVCRAGNFSGLEVSKSLGSEVSRCRTWFAAGSVLELSDHHNKVTLRTTRKLLAVKKLSQGFIELTVF
jgi:hypothetical protein